MLKNAIIALTLTFAAAGGAYAYDARSCDCGHCDCGESCPCGIDAR